MLENFFVLYLEFRVREYMNCFYRRMGERGVNFMMVGNLGVERWGGEFVSVSDIRVF